MDKSTQDVARREQDRYYGKYRGLVADNQDPEKRGRLRVRVPSVLGDQLTDWALPCFPIGGLAGQGLFAVPEMNAQLWIEFEEGDLQHPIWTGTFYQQQADVPGSPYGSSKSPQSYVLQTSGGHQLRFEGNERVLLEHQSGAAVELGTDGSAVLRDRYGNSLSMAADGVRLSAATMIVLDALTIQLGGVGGEPLVKGLAYTNHVHLPPPDPNPDKAFTGMPKPAPMALTIAVTGK